MLNLLRKELRLADQLVIFGAFFDAVDSQLSLLCGFFLHGPGHLLYLPFCQRESGYFLYAPAPAA